jgi:hypothetical protein
MRLFTEAVRAYKRGGVKEVLKGGFHLLLRKAGYSIPYLVRKYSKEANEEMSKLSDKGIGPRITEFPLLNYKSSDTLFILGSGGSINDISDEKWSHIDEHDSVGLNRWPVHSHVPTYHVFELPPESEGFWEDYRELLNRRRHEYEDIPIILKDVARISDSIETHHLPEWLVGNLIVSCDTNFGRAIHADVERNEKLLRYLDSRSYFSRDGDIKVLYRKRGSISYLIHFGIVLGYKKIVLCGVDMVDSKYFFDQKSDEYVRDDVPVPTASASPEQSDNKQKGSVHRKEDSIHRTNDTSVSPLTLEQVIYSMNDAVLERNGVNLYVENAKSALHPNVPLYEY